MTCLAMSMVGATSFLSWAKPSVERRQRDFLEHEWNDAAREVVAASPTPALNKCAAIEVVAVPPDALPATDDPHDRTVRLAHFVVDEAGRYARPAHALGSDRAEFIDPTTVRIDVVQPQNASTMTTRQWLGVQALIRAMHERAGASWQNLPVRIDLPAWEGGAPLTLPVGLTGRLASAGDLIP